MGDSIERRAASAGFTSPELARVIKKHGYEFTEQDLRGNDRIYQFLMDAVIAGATIAVCYLLS